MNVNHNERLCNIISKHKLKKRNSICIAVLYCIVTIILWSSNDERNPYSKMSVKLLRAAANGTFYFRRKTLPLPF